MLDDEPGRNREYLCASLFLCISVLLNVFVNFLDVPIGLPPAVADITNNSKGSKGKIENTGVHPFGGLFSQLLRSFGTNGALCRYTITKQRKTDDK